ncbi:hypothetical protein GCM10023334_059830 [Nonomuraea thailandensis]
MAGAGCETYGFAAARVRPPARARVFHNFGHPAGFLALAAGSLALGAAAA